MWNLTYARRELKYVIKFIKKQENLKLKDWRANIERLIVFISSDYGYQFIGSFYTID